MQFRAKLDTTAWKYKRDRGAVAVRNAPKVFIEAPGQEEKIRKAMQRGDELDFSPEARGVAAALLAEGVAELLNSPRRSSLRETMNQIGEYLAEDLSAQIVQGMVKGPARSPGWNKKKGHDVKLLYTGDLAAAIRHRLK
jgi:hypothetical protein